MAKVSPKRASRARQLRDQQAQAAKVKRGSAAIRKILEDEGLTITSPKVRVFFEDNGKLTGGDVITFSTLARMCNLPIGAVLIPQVTIGIKPGRPDTP